jgi:hypothetical protein
MRTPELFVNAEGMAMTRTGFEYVLDKHVRRAAETCPTLAGRTVSPHQLRHSCAVIMLQATCDIRKVALWLGHADIRTTEVYLRMDPSEKLEAVEAVVPPELRRGRFKAPDSLIASLLVDSAPAVMLGQVGATPDEPSLVPARLASFVLNLRPSGRRGRI